MRKALFLSLLSCFIGIGQLIAQDRTLSGTIKDETGQALPGVNVLLKGTNRGTNSDGDGAFKLSVPSAGTLVISSVGFETKEIGFTASTTQLSISLNTDVRTLGEVVVTALGIEKQAKTLTYAAQQVSGKSVQDVRDANFVNTLSGKVAGMVVTQGAGGPGSAVRVTMRGNRSIQGNNNALFVIDGVPIDNSTRGQVGNDFGGYNASDGVANINPDDIESMSILRGASAAALYGSRAANGVVIITTKKGKSGKIAVDINSGVVVESPLLLPAFQNTYTQGNGGTSNTTASGSWGGKGTTYSDNVSSFFRNAVSTNNSIGITGGSEKMTTYFSYTNNYNQGLVSNNDLKRHTVNLRVTNQISKRFSTDARVTFVNQKIGNKLKVGEESGIVMNLYKIPRSVSLTDYETYENADGTPRYWTTSSIYMNPYWTLNRTLNVEDRDRVMFLGSANYKLTDWLDVTARYSLDKYNDGGNYKFYNRTLLFAQAGGSYQVFNSQNTESYMDLIIKADKSLTKDLKLNALVGGSMNYRKNQLTQTNANGLLVPNKFDLSFARSLSVNTGFGERQINAVFGSAQLSFRDYLVLEGTVRQDWASTLPKPYSYSYPSVGATFILSEAFHLPEAISFAKVRASITKVGNDAPLFLLNQTYSFGQGGTGGFVSRDDTKAIEDLKPEITTSKELGLDLRFFSNRLGLDLTMYRTNSRNQLLQLGLAPASGFSSQYINAGNIQNTGVELALTAQPYRGAFNWNIGLNFARNVNKVVELSPDIKQAFLSGGYGRSAGPLVVEGLPYGDMYGFAWQRDSQGRLVVDAQGKPVSTSSQVKIGNFNPKFTLGFSNTFSWKGINAYLLIDGRFGGTITSGTDANVAFDGTADYTAANREGNWVLPAVTAAGEANTKAINAETFWTTVSGGRYSWGEFFTYDATTVRIREMSLGYDFKMPSAWPIKSARVSLVARNLLFLYRGSATLDIPGVGKRKLNYDPDVQLGAGNFQGVEYGNLPASRTVGLNLKLSF